MFLRLCAGLLRLPKRILLALRKIESLDLGPPASENISADLNALSFFCPPILCAADSFIIQLNPLDPLNYPIFNPSIVKNGDGFIVMARQSTLVNYAEYYYEYEESEHRTINYIYHLDANLKVTSVSVLDDSILRKKDSVAEAGIEDVRLFSYDGEIYGIGAGTRKIDGHFFVSQIVFKLGNKKIIEYFVAPQIGGRVEKNWVPFEGVSPITLKYSIADDFLIKFCNGHFLFPSERPMLDLKFRGGSPLVEFGLHHFLGIVHSSPLRFLDKIFYVHHFVVYDKKFRHIETSEPFFLRRRGIEFVCGLQIKNDFAYISYGVGDRVAEIARIHLKRIKEFLIYKSY